MIAALPRIFVVIVAFFGVLTIFLLPPIQAADEDSHLIRTVMVSRGDLSVRKEGDRFGQDVPLGLVEYVNSHRTMMGRSDIKYPYARWYADSHRMAEYEPTVFTPYSAQNASPLLYLPQATGVLTAKVFAKIAPVQDIAFSWSTAQYGARFGNLVAFLIIGGAAIAYVKRYRVIVFAAATLPMVVQQAASSSYDVTAISAALGFFSLLVGLLERGRPPRRLEICLLLVCAFMLGHAKAAYAPLLLGSVLLYRVMPTIQFVKLIGAMAVLSVIGLLLTTLIFGLPSDASLQEKFSEQSSWVRSHLWELPGLILHSLDVKKGFLFISYIANFGWLDTNLTLPALIVPVLALLTAVSADALDGPGLLRLKGVGIFLIAIVLSVTALHLAMYIYWTSIIQENGIGAPVVDGVQGRYFLPLTPFLLAIVAVAPAFMVRRVSNLRSDVALAHVVFVVLGLSLMMFAVLARYWIPPPA